MSSLCPVRPPRPGALSGTRPPSSPSASLLIDRPTETWIRVDKPHIERRNCRKIANERSSSPRDTRCAGSIANSLDFDANSNSELELFSLNLGSSGPAMLPIGEPASCGGAAPTLPFEAQNYPALCGRGPARHLSPQDLAAPRTRTFQAKQINN